LITTTAVKHYFKIVGCHSHVVEDSVLLACSAMSTGKQLAMLWQSIMPQNQEVSRTTLLLDPEVGCITWLNSWSLPYFLFHKIQLVKFKIEGK
jgi:hypothetical protein